MEDKELQLNSETAEVESVTVSVVKTAISTVFYLLVFLALAASLFVILFPYNAMRFYDDLGMKGQAFESAERYINSSLKKDKTIYWDSKCADAVLYSVDYSVLQMDYETAIGKMPDAAKTDFFAGKIKKYVELYSKISGVNERNALKDTYNRTYIIPNLRPNFYSFKDFTESKHFKATVYLEEARYETTKILYLNELNTLSLVRNDLANYKNDSKSVEETDMNRFVNVFNQIGEYLKFELTQMGFYSAKRPNTEENIAKVARSLDAEKNYFTLLVNADKTQFTPLYAVLNDVIDKFRDFAVGYEVGGNAAKLLQKAYWVKSIDNFIPQMWYLSCVLYAAGSGYFGNDLVTTQEYRALAPGVNAWQLHNKCPTIDNSLDISQYYYQTLLPYYVRLAG